MCFRITTSFRTRIRHVRRCTSIHWLWHFRLKMPTYCMQCSSRLLEAYMVPSGAGSTCLCQCLWTLPKTCLLVLPVPTIRRPMRTRQVRQLGLTRIVTMSESPLKATLGIVRR
eukprot:Rmarinus@m.19283